MRKDYKGLLARRDELDNDFLAALVELLTTYGQNGKITFRPEGVGEDDDIADYDGDFPVRMTLWGAGGNPCIDVTELFLSEDGSTVYARGIEVNMGCMSDEDFEIFTDHYCEALSFILIVLDQQGVEL